MDTLTSSAPESAESRLHPPILVFAGGKQGVGKTSVVANVAAALAARGKNVCVFDADSGMSSINGLFGLRPRQQLREVLSGEKSIDDVLVATTDGVSVVPGALAIAGLPLTELENRLLLDALAELERRSDFLLIDTAAPVSELMRHFIERAPFTFLVVTADPAALTDGFALLKALKARGYRRGVRVIVNLAADYPAATDTFRRFAAVAEKCLQLKVEYGGFVVRDDNVPRAAALQMSVMDLAANSPASRCLLALADNIIRHMGGAGGAPTLPVYWQQVMDGTALPQPVTRFDEIPAMPAREVVAVAQPDAGVAELGRQLSALMRNPSLDQAELERFVGDFVEDYCEHFGRFPLVFRQLFYRWLEAESYPASRLVELATTLEALHATRYQRPMFSPEETVARLVVQLDGQQALHRELIEQLSAAYRQSYHVDVVDAEQVLLEAMQNEEFTEQHFEDLLQRLRDGFQIRFKRPYRDQHEVMLASAVEVLNAMAIDEQNLRDEIAMLGAGFQLLNSRREKLLAAISAMQEASPGSVSLQ